jgi:hypothetical protein
MGSGVHMQGWALSDYGRSEKGRSCNNSPCKAYLATDFDILPLAFNAALLLAAAGTPMRKDLCNWYLTWLMDEKGTCYCADPCPQAAVRLWVTWWESVHVTLARRLCPPSQSMGTVQGMQCVHKLYGDNCCRSQDSLSCTATFNSHDRAGAGYQHLVLSQTDCRR